MYTKIVVPMALDHGLSPVTLAVADKLRSDDGQIIALHVYDLPESAAKAVLDKSLLEEGFARARSLLHEKTAGYSNVSARIVRGHTYRSIVDEAAKEDADCIVMGSHRPGLSDYLLGSTSARVVRHAPCAVHVCRGT